MANARDLDAHNYREIEDMITFMVLCERGFGVSDMEFFDGATRAFRSLLDQMNKEIKVVSGRRENSIDIAADNIRNIRGSIIFGGDDSKDRMILCGAREMSLSDKNKLSSIKKRLLLSEFGVAEIPIDPNKRIIEVRTVGIRENGEARAIHRNHLIREKRGRWVPISPPKILGNEYENEAKSNYEDMSFKVGVGWSACARKWWQVFIRFKGHTPGISLFTDATGIKDFFRFRDIPEGKSRRDALVHWVSSHWRQNRYDPEVENYVREYLRGQRIFHWHGLEVEIVLPQSDNEREAAAIEGRKRLSRLQLDRRIREFRKRI